ncbi:MAG TPA: hypothetical protein DGN60_07175 [Chloroflexi bacterium]|nr:hypothetical protein [Chloroflexota bacterium]|tara:strand:+ start:1289 stop:1915 length:627 start_codon:yes stop_codon:yes gene_type:complete
MNDVNSQEKTNLSIPIGRMLRSDTTGFTFGCLLPEPEVPLFGDFVKAPAQQGLTEIIGIIHNIVIEDDLFVRQLIAAPELPEAYIQDQRKNRQIPIEVSVLSVGYSSQSNIIQGLPPQPPVTLDYIKRCSLKDVIHFTDRQDYLALILNSKETPTEELIAAALQRASQARPIEDREIFLLQAGKELARLLSDDLSKLNSILRRIQVNT